ncbi:hypothetical protein M0R72_18025 [Candidatus Pacearchaeota archaeon]|jgi:hypothetical protein|nr:hypothetical protein [Candidatus Pacearchaeota archaeon]
MAEQSVRSAVRDHLATNCPSFTGGFLYPQIADNNTVKPFGVVRMGPHEKEAKQGAVRRLYVHVHTVKDAWDALDTLCNSVVSALDCINVSCGSSGGKTFWITPYHVGTTADATDDDRMTIFRICEFEVVTGR